MNLSYRARVLRRSTLLAASAVPLVLAGCGAGLQSASAPVEVGGYTMSGMVHYGSAPVTTGGYKAAAVIPVSGATVRLFAAAASNTGATTASGYGSAATLLATTTSSTNGGGGFSFIQGSQYAGSNPATSNTYACPTYTFKSTDGTATITKDALLYIVVSGGNTGSGTNSSAALMTAVGGCAGYQAAPFFLDVDAVTTVATVFALAPYMSPVYTTAANGPGSNLGTSTAYQAAYSTSASSPVTGLTASQVAVPMGYTGLLNAFESIGKLTDLTAGVVRNPYTVTANGASVTATPEATKINTIADVLAYCIDSAGTSTNCATLFGYTVPPPSSSRTSLGSGVTFPTATDTIQAAYYMATNPTDFAAVSTATAPNATLSSTGASIAGTNIANLYNLVSSTSDYQPTLSSQPSDWTISIAYTSASTCGTDTTQGLFIGATPYAASVDLSGNVAFINGATAATLSGLTTTGVPNFCLLGAYSNGRTVMTDVAGNVWASTSSGTTTYLPQYNIAGGTLTKWQATVDGTTFVTPYAVSGNGRGDVFYTYTGAGSLYEFAGAAFTTTTANSTLQATSSTAYNLYYLAVDSASNFSAPHASSTIFTNFPFQTAATASPYFTAVQQTVSAAISTGYGIATDANGAVYGGNTCCSSTVANEVFKIPLTYSTTSSVTTSTAGTPVKSLAKNYGGVDGVRSVAVDGAGNVWVGNYYTAYGSASTTTALGTGVWAVSEMDSSFNSISSDPATAITGTNCVSTSQYTCPDYAGYIKTSLGASRGLIVDQSGNVWVPSDLSLNNGTGTGAATAPGAIVEIIGAGVPTVQPLSIAARDGKLATKP